MTSRKSISRYPPRLYRRRRPLCTELIGPDVHYVTSRNLGRTIGSLLRPSSGRSTPRARHVTICPSWFTFGLVFNGPPESAGSPRKWCITMASGRLGRLTQSVAKISDPAQRMAAVADFAQRSGRIVALALLRQPHSHPRMLAESFLRMYASSGNGDTGGGHRDSNSSCGTGVADRTSDKRGLRSGISRSHGRGHFP